MGNYISKNPIRVMRRMAKRSLEALVFDNTALKGLPVDESKVMSQREVRGACFSLVELTPLTNPRTVAVSKEALALLDIDETDNSIAASLSGSKLIPGSQPAAHCYCGHQFGNFAGQLGDGATMYLGEITNASGAKWELQIKGGGKTPYSRQGDGRKVLRSSLREFLCSEAMYYLNVPTTRSASLIASDDKVVRDIQYDGNAKMETCSVITRIAPTFLRFGSFEICKKRDPETMKAGPSVEQPEILSKLIEFARESFFTSCSVLQMYEKIVQSTAYLVARWQCVGWCHGVLNTDNMSILGITIDYGPYGFLEGYDEGYICNASDTSGRYTYGEQPKKCKWNLMKLKESLTLAHPEMQSELEKTLEKYTETYERFYYNMMGRKMGLIVGTQQDVHETGLPAGENTVPDEVPNEVREMVDSFNKTMGDTYSDFTDSFRSLSAGSNDEMLTRLVEASLSPSAVAEALLVRARSTKLMFEPSQLQMILSMPHMQAQLSDLSNHDPKIEVIRDEANKLYMLSDLVESIEGYKKQNADEKKKIDTGKWASFLEQYSKAKKIDGHVAQMEGLNPCFILRQWVLQDIIAKAEKGDNRPLEEMLERVKTPFTPSPVDEKYRAKPDGAVVVT
eukprot:TRINITY_DN16434_c0_g1_i2.p1 TRINITY_DN16434_c0_g1~~TRINITY_DN16434_c0_g1_i2.p1  ORF type:complete len:622 (+),score=128.31 TRINITY_DN16434_c0_g1_i2:1228-3093(+)